MGYSWEANALVHIRNPVLYCAFIINTSAIGTASFLAVGFNVVVTKLANLRVILVHIPPNSAQTITAVSLYPQTNRVCIPGIHKGTV